ncbi:MAG: hypothetical protein ABJG68_05085 [Crocinitomicaceae bacterium]
MIDFFITIFSKYPGLIVGGVILGFIGLVSQMSLYAKAGQPAIAALVPVWNVMVFCKVVGRPASHAWFLIIPGIVMMGIVIAFWPIIDGLFPAYVENDGIWLAPKHSLSEATVPFIIMGVAALPLIYFVIVMFTEVCDSFGKHSMIDKVLCVIFNGFYILFVLGISSAVYESPWWARKRGKPYYMPDFKHKGKKYLVTPEGPLTGDYRKQKMKVAIVDEKVAEEVDPEKIAAEKFGNKKTDSISEKAAGNVEKVAEKKAEKPIEEAAKKEEKVVEKKGEIKKPAAKSTAKKEPKLKADGTPMTWREEMAEKYKKK